MNIHHIKATKFKHLAKVSLFGLICTIAYAKVILPQSAIGVLWLLPLLAPVYGIIKDKPYTYAWSGFISGTFVAHAFYAIMTVETIMDFRIASFEILFSVGLFFGAVFHIKHRHLAKQANEQSTPEQSVSS